jgi:hypothetical protein
MVRKSPSQTHDPLVIVSVESVAANKLCLRARVTERTSNTDHEWATANDGTAPEVSVHGIGFDTVGKCKS